jgi:formylglycine-generating enzyme required for sulfatase activity
MKLEKRYIILTAIFVFSFYLYLPNVLADTEIEEQEIWVAVHDFSVSANLKKEGVSGWNIAGRIENELAQKGIYRIVTRARIAKVLKEKNIKSTGSMDASNFGKIVGADFIVTGQLSLNGDKLTLVGKLVDVSGETGEIEKSFDITIHIPENESPARYFNEMFEEMADKLTMSPGNFLNYGIAMLDEGKYLQAVEAFREVKRITPVDKIRDIFLQYQPYNYKINYLTSKRSPGELLDYGIIALKKKKYREAVTVFEYFENVTPFEKIKSIMQIGDMLKNAQDKAEEQKKVIMGIISKASKMYLTAKGKEVDRINNMSPEELCDTALVELENLLINPKIHLSNYERLKIKGLMQDIKGFRGTLFAGPVKERNWKLQDLGIKMVPIKDGYFEMGDPKTINPDNKYLELNNKLHIVEITQPFWIAETEITIGQFLYYLRNPDLNPNAPKKYDKDKNINWDSKYCPITKKYRMKRGKGSTWGDLKLPMVCVNWKGARQFCEWLTYREKKAKRLPDGYIYRLPTESEWEYCCRAGSKGKYGHENLTSNTLFEYVWYQENSLRKTHVVGTKKANSWGLYDMHGNVWEWCNDWYGPYLDQAKDPVGPDDSNDNEKVLRGGSFASNESDLYTYTRYPKWYKTTKKNIGFRIVLAPEI